MPAFSGLGAPYWNSGAKAILCGMTRITGKNEIVRAALDRHGALPAGSLDEIDRADALARETARAMIHKQ